MSISKDYKISWSDIEDIYKYLNNVKTKFTITPLTLIPENKKTKIKTENIEDLKNSIESLSTNAYIGSKAITNLNIPNKKTKIKPLEFSQLNNILKEINQICPENTVDHTGECSTYCPDYGDCSTNKENCPDYDDCGTDKDHCPDYGDCSTNKENCPDYGDCSTNKDHCPEDACQPDYTSYFDNNYHYSDDCGLDCPRDAAAQPCSAECTIDNSYNYRYDCGEDCPNIVT